MKKKIMKHFPISILMLLNITFIFNLPLLFGQASKASLSSTQKAPFKVQRKALKKAENRKNKLYKLLALTPAQHAQIKAHQSEHLKKRKVIHQEIILLKKKLDQYLAQNPNTKDIGPIQDIKLKLDKQQAALTDLHLKAKTHFNSILDEKQRQKLQKMKARKRSHRSQYKKQKNEP